jgi:hypothetical protein
MTDAELAALEARMIAAAPIVLDTNRHGRCHPNGKRQANADLRRSSSQWCG